MPDDYIRDTSAEESMRMRQKYGVEEVEGKTMGVYGPLTGEGERTLFKLRAQLLTEGRSIHPLAETENLRTWIKVYATGGENTLHAHTTEDHMFVILDGEGSFYGPNGEKKVLKRNDGLMLPAGTFYHFNSSGDEPLVLLRVGSRAAEGNIKKRMGIDGVECQGGTDKNKFTAPTFSDKYYE